MQLPNELKQAIDNNAFCSIATKIYENEILEDSLVNNLPHYLRTVGVLA